MQNLKVTFPEPQQFQIENLITGMGAGAKDFYHYRKGNVINLMYNDAYGLYRAKLHLFDTLSNRFNYVEYMQFELDEQDRVTAITPGHSSISKYDILYRLKDADKTGQEYKVIKTYSDQIHRQMYQAVDTAVQENPAKYTSQSPESDAVIAGVFQGNYAAAHGPQQEIKYLGTYGIGPCVGASIVTRVEGEEHPHVTIVHIDALSELESSISRILYQNGFKDGKTEVTLVSGSRSDEDLIRVTQAFARQGINPTYDVESFGSKSLIVDLKTGNVVDPSLFASVSWLGPKKEKLDYMIMFKSMVMTKQPLSQEFDLRRGVPQGYQAHTLAGFDNDTRLSPEVGKSSFDFC